MQYLLILFLVIIIIVVIKSKVKIDIPSFLHDTIPLALGVFGVYCFDGKQGQGKTYSVNKFIRKHAKGKKIYSNITLKNLKYTHLTSIDQLLALRDEKNCYIIYDEIFTIMSKTSNILTKKQKEDMEEFLTQQRKMGNIFITTAQEWLNIPIEFRRFVRIRVECRTRTVPLIGWGILIETYYDATNMKWSNLDNEYVAPLITKKISKYEKRFMITYDTFERIKKLQ